MLLRIIVATAIVAVASFIGSDPADARRCKSGILSCYVKKKVRDRDDNRSFRSGERASIGRPAPTRAEKRKTRDRLHGLFVRPLREEERGAGCLINMIKYISEHGANKPRSLAGLRGCRLYAADARFHRVAG